MTEQATPETTEIETETTETEMIENDTTTEPTATDAEPMAAAEPEPVAKEAAAEEAPVAEAAPAADAPAADADAAADAASDAAAAPASDDAAGSEAPAAETEPVAADEPSAAASEAPARANERAPKGGSRKAAAIPSEPAADAAEAPASSGPRGFQQKYRTDVVPALVKQFEYRNPNQVPKVSKIVVNIGLGEALTNAKAIDAASGDLTMITGQKPIVMKARRSIAQFKIRTGNPIGLKVTLRGQRMWDFLERLTLLALPRIRDFRGTPGRSFDGRGNYTLGLREQIAFPEIDYDKVDRLRGLEVSIVTTAKSDEESKRLLELLGMPFGG